MLTSESSSSPERPSPLFGRASLLYKLLPLLTLMLLLSPLGFLSEIVHEFGHDVVSFLQGGTVSGITITSTGGYADATATSLMFAGGWLGQYAFAVVALLYYRLRKPASFLANAVILWIVVWNLLDPPFYISTLTADASNLFSDLSGTLSVGASVAIIEGVATGLLLAGLCVSWKHAESSFERMFGWVGRKSAGAAATVLLAFILLTIFSGYYSPLSSIPSIAQLIPPAALAALFLAIPSVPSSSQRSMPLRPLLIAFVAAIALFALGDLFSIYLVPFFIPL